MSEEEVIARGSKKRKLAELSESSAEVMSPEQPRTVRSVLINMQAKKKKQENPIRVEVVELTKPPAKSFMALKLKAKEATKQEEP